MTNYSTSAFVLHRHNLGESDRILTLLTKDHGLIRAVAKGVRRSKSKLAGHLEPFARIALSCAKGRNLDIITSAQADRPIIDFGATLEVMQVAHAINELVFRILEENAGEPVVFELYGQAIGGLAKETTPELVYNAFALKFLQILGHAPRLDVVSADKYYLAFDSGTIVTQRPTEQSEEIFEAEIKLWRYLLDQPFGRVFQLKGSERHLVHSTELLERFISWHMGIRLRAMKVYI